MVAHWSWEEIRAEPGVPAQLIGTGHEVMFEGSGPQPRGHTLVPAGGLLGTELHSWR